MQSYILAASQQPAALDSGDMEAAMSADYHSYGSVRVDSSKLQQSHTAAEGGDDGWWSQVHFPDPQGPLSDGSYFEGSNMVVPGVPQQTAVPTLHQATPEQQVAAVHGGQGLHAQHQAHVEIPGNRVVWQGYSGSEDYQQQWQHFQQQGQHQQEQAPAQAQKWQLSNQAEFCWHSCAQQYFSANSSGSGALQQQVHADGCNAGAQHAAAAAAAVGTPTPPIPDEGTLAALARGMAEQLVQLARSQPDLILNIMGTIVDSHGAPAGGQAAGGVQQVPLVAPAGNTQAVSRPVNMVQQQQQHSGMEQPPSVPPYAVIQQLPPRIARRRTPAGKRRRLDAAPPAGQAVAAQDTTPMQVMGALLQLVATAVQAQQQQQVQ